MSTVLVIPDTHCPGMRRGFVDFLKRTSDLHQPDRIVHIGDLVDWQAISYHEKNPNLGSPYEEFKKAKKQVHKLAEAFPNVDWLIGNHDALTHRQARTAGLPAEVIKSYNEIWEIDWKVYPRFSKLRIESVFYTHGDSGPGGKFAAISQAKDNFRSTVIGHFHSHAGVMWWANHEFRVFGMNVGCGIDVNLAQFDYGKRFTSKPLLGCGIVQDGKRAFFEPWLLRSR